MGGISSLGGFSPYSSYQPVTNNVVKAKESESTSATSMRNVIESQAEDPSKENKGLINPEPLIGKPESDKPKITDFAPAYNSRAAMELGGFKVNQEQDIAETQQKSKQAADMYQSTLLAQKNQEQNSVMMLA